MSRVIIEKGIRTIILEDESLDNCELCGKVDELRPYGPNFERICFECMMKDEETAKVRFAQVLYGKSQGEG